MTLIARISRLFKADFHAVLDQVEEPRLLLQQAIREMEEELHAGELRWREMAVEREGLNTRQQTLQRAVTDMDEELDLCFDDGKSELAREIIKRKLQIHYALQQVAARLEAVEKALQESKKALANNRASLESARQKAELFRGPEPHRESSNTSASDRQWAAGEFAVTDSDIEVAFLREKKRRVQA